MITRLRNLVVLGADYIDLNFFSIAIHATVP